MDDVSRRAEAVMKLDRQVLSMTSDINTRAYRNIRRYGGTRSQMALPGHAAGGYEAAQRQLRRQIGQLQRQISTQVQNIITPQGNDGKNSYYKRRAGTLSAQLQQNRVYFTAQHKEEDECATQQFIQDMQLQEDYEAQKVQLHQVTHELQNLHNSSKGLQDIVDNLNQLIKELKQQIEAKDQTIVQLQLGNSDACSKVKQLQDDLSGKNKELEEEKHRVAEMRTREQQQSELIVEQQQQIERLTEQLAESHAKYQRKKEKLKEYRRLSLELQQQTVEFNQTVMAQSQANMTLQTSIDSLQQQLTEKTTQLGTSQQNRSAQQQDQQAEEGPHSANNIIVVQQDESRLRAQLDRCQNILMQQIEQKRGELDGYRQMHETVNGNIQQMKREMMDQRAQFIDMENQFMIQQEEQLGQQMRSLIHQQQIAESAALEQSRQNVATGAERDTLNTRCVAVAQPSDQRVDHLGDSAVQECTAGVVGTLPEQHPSQAPTANADEPVLQSKNARTGTSTPCIQSESAEQGADVVEQPNLDNQQRQDNSESQKAQLVDEAVGGSGVESLPSQEQREVNNLVERLEHDQEVEEELTSKQIQWLRKVGYKVDDKQGE